MQGLQGAAGGFDPGKIVLRVTGDIPIAAFSVAGDLSAFCAAGERAIAGGYFSDVGFAYSDHPDSGGAGWNILIDNSDSSVSGHGNGYVVCVRP